MFAEALRGTLNSLQDEALALEEVDAMDMDRLAVLKEFAGELLDEAEYLFSVISGRLYAVSYHLAHLEETEAAERFSSALDLDRVDRVLTGFRSFHDEFRAARQPDLTLIMKGVQTARAIEQIFETPKLQTLLEASLVRRTTRLLADYVALVRGMRFSSTEPTNDLERVLAELIHGLDIGSFDAEHFIESADDAEAYLIGLVARLAFPPAFRNVQTRFIPSGQCMAVAMAPDRLGDMVMSLLEIIAASGAAKIDVECKASEVWVCIQVSGEVTMEPVTLRRMDLSRRILAPLGGRLDLYRDAKGDSFVIEMPRLGATTATRRQPVSIF
jgi:hypothetical protein